MDTWVSARSREEVDRWCSTEGRLDAVDIADVIKEQSLGAVLVEVGCVYVCTCISTSSFLFFLYKKCKLKTGLNYIILNLFLPSKPDIGKHKVKKK